MRVSVLGSESAVLRQDQSQLGPGLPCQWYSVPWKYRAITVGVSRLFSVIIPGNFRVALLRVKFYRGNITEDVYMLTRNFFPRYPSYSRHGIEHVIPRCFPWLFASRVGLGLILWSWSWSCSVALGLSLGPILSVLLPTFPSLFLVLVLVLIFWSCFQLSITAEFLKQFTFMGR